MQAKKIIIIGNTASMMLNFRSDLMSQLVREGHEVFAFVSEFKETEIQKLRNLNVSVVTYSLNRAGINPFSDLKTLFELKNKISKIKPDIVFSYFTKPVVYGSLAAKLAKIQKIVGMIEGLGSPFTEHKNGQTIKIKVIKFVQISLYRIVFPFLDKIIFLNKDDPIDLIEKNKIFTKKDAVKVLGPIGLNLKDYPYKAWVASKSVSFIFVARLLAEKGIYEYLEAAKIVKLKYPKTIFKVIGGLDLENPYGLSQSELDKLIASKLIEYPGYVNNVSEHIADSAVFVLPSYYREGVPRSTQEAMAIGRPVITTDIPGCRDTVIDGVNGFLIPKWDVNALVEKMCFFIENPEQINIMGKESYKIACEKFDVHKVNKKLFEIMEIED